AMDLGELGQELCERLQSDAFAAGCSLSLAIEGCLKGQWDRSALERALLNLLSNSLKYARGAPVELSLRGKDGKVFCHVSDKGPGIPEGKCEAIFERFERASTTTSVAGLGLGLYIVRQIVLAHQGVAIMSARVSHFSLAPAISPSTRRVGLCGMLS